MRHRTIVGMAILALALVTATAALAARAPKKFATKTTLAVGQVQTGEGAAPVIEGKITSPKPICRKGRQISGTFTPGDGESVITLQGAASKADGSWSSDLTASDGGLSGSLEIQVAPKTVGSTVCKGTFAKKTGSL